MTDGWFHAPKAITDESGAVVGASDWLGNRFDVNDRVLYCIGAGRGQMMAIGKVLKIVGTPSVRRTTREAHYGETPDREFERSDGVVVKIVYVDTPYIEVKVQVLTLKTSGAWDNEKRTRPAWPNPMNITSLRGIDEQLRADEGH